ncbi:acyl carrier protein [Pseudoxanthomonas wuyuanensis]|uniref:Acyl carrier protein n=1 Tax=Pseudoxanthomonas wuyuanensis TaxID=1073196 RepID=A0A286CYD1_9GAMM|nr:acyl carrier protein [Pseudoxanthomonas wuyuanensis]KAF1722812.1 acyl carrier protein [Pseudoxanthomonas wuyuanensis]SOD51407.1 Acyl carrier protein [Pseudoxanthomonas wuyuanensis]
MQAIKTSVRQYIQDNFLMGSAETYADDASFMDAQLLDSTGFLELVHFLEDSYGIKVEDEEMMPENLDSLDAVARFVMRKQAA